jgi:hypothetical protein
MAGDIGLQVCWPWDDVQNGGDVVWRSPVGA